MLLPAPNLEAGRRGRVHEMKIVDGKKGMTKLSVETIVASTHCSDLIANLDRSQFPYRQILLC